MSRSRARRVVTSGGSGPNLGLGLLVWTWLDWWYNARSYPAQSDSVFDALALIQFHQLPSVGGLLAREAMGRHAWCEDACFRSAWCPSGLETMPYPMPLDTARWNRPPHALVLRRSRAGVDVDEEKEDLDSMGDGRQADDAWIYTHMQATGVV